MYDVCMYMGIPMPQHTVALRGCQVLWKVVLLTEQPHCLPAPVVTDFET